VSTDLRVTGSWGLYRIHAATRPGKAWVRKHLRGGERTVLDNGDTMCEGSREIRDIVAAADRAGLSVDVNGQDMKGFGAT
jgi:hypothetical protein